MNNHYPFDILNYKSTTEEKTLLLRGRPFASLTSTFVKDAPLFVAGKELESAINTAIAVGEPLLITGEPGTGKTQAAYYAAYKLGVEPVLHFQVKSTSTAADLLYHFDTVRYFHDASVTRGPEGEHHQRKLNKSDYVEKRDLWLAIESEIPRVLLIDEIDKAPRDFPNDLLLELDQMTFKIPETQQVIDSTKGNRPIVFITSNSERRLPEPFLRRCVYHHIRFSEEILSQAVQQRREEYKELSDDFIELAKQRLMSLREQYPAKLPTTGEFLVWLRVLSYQNKQDPAHFEELFEQIQDERAALPYAGVLLKNDQD